MSSGDLMAAIAFRRASKCSPAWARRDRCSISSSGGSCAFAAGVGTLNIDSPAPADENVARLNVSPTRTHCVRISFVLSLSGHGVLHSPSDEAPRSSPLVGEVPAKRGMGRRAHGGGQADPPQNKCRLSLALSPPSVSVATSPMKGEETHDLNGPRSEAHEGKRVETSFG